MSSEREEMTELVRGLVRSFAREQLAPALDALENGRQRPFDLCRELAERLGLEPLAAESIERASKQDSPESKGDLKAAAAGTELMAVVMQELSRVSPGFALSFGASIGLCAQTILHQGTPEQRTRWALPTLAFRKIGCWAVTEPEAGSDAFGLRTTATRDGDGWVISGSKTFITNAPFADVFVIHARLANAGALDGRIAGFVLEKGMPGLTVSPPFDKMGMRASPTGAIFLDSVRAGREHLLGPSDEGTGKRGVMLTLLGERLALGAMALGIIEESLALSLAYAKERQQFGQPIAQFQAVQLRLARMYAAQETVRALLERAFRMARSKAPDIAALCASKYTSSTLATEAALEAVQVLGGNGYMREFRVEMLARDAKLLEIGGGTSDIQLLTVARELLKN